MVLNSASHHTLLDIIQDKESELSRIRQAASVAAQEETKGIEKQLLELQQDCSHHVELLHDKDDIIHRLQDQLLQIERDHLKTAENIQRNCDELSNVQIAKSTANAEGEIRKRLQRDYEDKLFRKEEDLERDYQSVLVNQIRDQESLLYGTFDREIADREKGHMQQLNDLKRDMEMKDKEILGLLYSSEQKYEERESRTLDEAKMRLEGETRTRLEDSERQWKMRMRSLEEEKEQYGRDLNRIGQDRLQLEVDNRELNWKVEELLSVIQHLQGENTDNCKHFENQKKELKSEVTEWEQRCLLLETLLKDEDANHQKQRYKAEKSTKLDRKALTRVMKKLKKDLVTLKDEKNDADELLKEKQDIIHTSRHRLKDKVTSLRKDCHDLRMEIDSMHSKSLIHMNTESKVKEDFARALKEKEHAQQSIRKQMRLEHDTELERNAKQQQQEQLDLTRERDDARIDRDRLEAKIREMDEECKDRRSEVSIVQNRLRDELQVMSIRNHDIREHNSKLKETIKTMRNELETLMSSFMEAREQCACSKKKPLKTDIEQHTYKDGTRRNDCAKPRLENEQIDMLKKRLKNTLADYEGMCIERDHLLNLSNKLRAEVYHLQQSSADKDTTNEGDDESADDIDVDDLAESVWARAVSKQRRPIKSVRASDRATASQDNFLRKKQVEQNVPNTSMIRARKQNVRNWNRKYDDPVDPP